MTPAGRMSRASQRFRKVFQRRYLIALSLLAAEATITFVTSYRVAAVESDRTRAVNMVNGQRVYSQRIAFLIAALGQPQTPAREATLREELRVTIAGMRAAHATLSGATARPSRVSRYVEPLQPIYHEGPNPFDQSVRQYLEAAEAIMLSEAIGADESLARRDEVLSLATDSVLQTHDLMVRIMEAEARRAVRTSEQIDFSLYMFVMGMLIAILVFIFRPMRESITKAFEDLEGAQSRARRATEEASAANEAKSHFLQAASHEIKTPLNAILGLTETIRDKSDDRIKDELVYMSAAGDHLLTLLNNILDTHKIAEGDLKLEHKPFDLHEAIERPMRLCEMLARDKGLAFEHETDVPKGLVVEGDRGRLEQVLINLLDNAVKFTDKGKVTFRTRVNKDGTGSLIMTASVEDTGVGISPQRQKEIFERFSAEGSMLTRNGGLGVGLSLARELVTMMGGSIDVTSEEGRGSKFVVELPLEIKAGTLTPHQQVEEAEKILSEVLSNKQPEAGFDVLIVDDNLANRMVLEALVKPLGGRAVMAVDGRQAVSKAGERKFDIILMDISMPVMDGIQATELIRAGAGPSKRAPIVAVTAHVSSSDTDEMRRKGFQDVVSKPVRKDTMHRCIDRWVKLAEPVREGA